MINSSEVKTMGQAVDAAILRHGEIYRDSKVYDAHVREHKDADTWVVQVYADHFSTPMTYVIRPKTTNLLGPDVKKRFALVRLSATMGPFFSRAFSPWESRQNVALRTIGRFETRAEAETAKKSTRNTDIMEYLPLTGWVWLTPPKTAKPRRITR
jgi:hypothetical protein